MYAERQSHHIRHHRAALKSRGIPQADAERLVVEGFFDPIMQRIPFEGVRERFQQAIQDKLSAS